MEEKTLMASAQDLLGVSEEKIIEISELIESSIAKDDFSMESILDDLLKNYDGNERLIAMISFGMASAVVAYETEGI